MATYRRAMKASPMLETLYSLAQEHGLHVTEPAPGHFQIHGPLLVNYYPFSKNRTAVVDRTTRGRKHVEPWEAVQMALRPPELAPEILRHKRRHSYKSVRKRLLKKNPHCFWCGTLLTLETSTLDHRIPLGRGGIDESSNFVLACEGCNTERGCDMPEVTEENYVQRKRENHSGQHQSSGRAPADPADAVLAGHPCGANDAPDVQPQCQQQPRHSDPEDAGASEAGPGDAVPVWGQPAWDAG